MDLLNWQVREEVTLKVSNHNASELPKVWLKAKKIIHLLAKVLKSVNNQFSGPALVITNFS